MKCSAYSAALMGDELNSVELTNDAGDRDE